VLVHEAHFHEARPFLGRAARRLTFMALRIIPDLAGTLVFFALTWGWLAADAVCEEPPDYFARLIDEGSVTFVFYDPIREPRTHRGFTTFHLDVSYRSSFQYRWVDQAGGRQVTIEPKIGPISYKLVNEVQLPENLNHDRRWTNSLVKHEFDHVAMTLDPRVRLLIDHLCAGTPVVVENFPAGAQVTGESVERLIHKEVEPRYQSVLKLLIANEHDLDKVTRHGLRNLPHRREYFEFLFTEPNLKQHGFRYLNEVKPLLRKKSYREAKLPYDLRN
jgi:hypothetical protein